MYMERIRPDLTIAAPHRRSARLAAGGALIAGAALLALPYWIALGLWLAALLAAKAGSRLLGLAYETILYAGDLALGRRPPAAAVAVRDRR